MRHINPSWLTAMMIYLLAFLRFVASWIAPFRRAFRAMHFSESSVFVLDPQPWVTGPHLYADNDAVAEAIHDHLDRSK